MRNMTGDATGGLPFPYGATTSDEELRAAVLNGLHWHSGVPQERIRVVVENGRVTLAGTLEQAMQREIAEAETLKTPGVREVTNLIEIEQKS